MSVEKMGRLIVLPLSPERSIAQDLTVSVDVLERSIERKIAELEVIRVAAQRLREQADGIIERERRRLAAVRGER